VAANSAATSAPVAASVAAARAVVADVADLQLASCFSRKKAGPGASLFFQGCAFRPKPRTARFYLGFSLL